MSRTTGSGGESRSVAPFLPEDTMRKIFVTVAAALLLAAFALPASAAEVEEGFLSLFNGQDLAGWVKRGGSAE